MLQSWHPMAWQETGFDVFLSYARVDAPAVLDLKKRLEGMGVRTLIDTDLRPGTNWSDDLQMALSSAPAIAILVGPGDLGATQEQEVQLALMRQVEEKRAGRTLPVIPVVLPGSKPSRRNLFTNQNTWVNLADGFIQSELDRLYFGITGEHLRTAPSTAVTHKRLDTTVSDALGALAPRLAEGGVSFLLGSGVARPPSMADLVYKLTASLRENCPNLPDIPTLELAASCLAVDRGDEMAIEDGIRPWLGDIGSTGAFPVHSALAGLAATVSQQSRARLSSAIYTRRQNARDRVRAAQRHEPLVIVASTYDVLMERALLRKGIRFVRCVQHHTAQTIVIDEFEPDDYGDVSRESHDELDRVITDVRINGAAVTSRARELPKIPVVLSSGEPPDVVLYKTLGSRDVSGSCFISGEQHYRFLYESLKDGRLPDEITSPVRNNRLVFLGYTLFDPVLRLLRYSLLADRPSSVPCFAVKTQPPDEERTLDHRLEAALWTDAGRAWSQRFSVTFIECDEVQFLEDLTSRLLGGA